MKKVTPIVIYRITDKIEIYSFYVHHKNDITPMISNNDRIFQSFDEMYKYVLTVLKMNNMYAGKVVDFNTNFHDIVWINYDFPGRMETKSYKGKV